MGERDNQKENEDKRKEQSIQAEKNEDTNETSEGKINKGGNDRNEGTMVIYGTSLEDVSPLAIQNENIDEGEPQKKGIRDKADISSCINKVAIEGDLSPKHSAYIKRDIHKTKETK